MAGSRKGEKRGAAGSPISKARGGATSGPKAPRKVRVRASQVKREEYYRDIQRLIDAPGESDIEPREVLLEAMRYFHAEANEAKQHKSWIMSRLGECSTDDQFAQIDKELRACAIDIRDAYLLAVDCGFKVAPYIHAKLSSVELSGPDKQPIEIMAILMKEITAETAGKPSWAQESASFGPLIEHDPAE